MLLEKVFPLLEGSQVINDGNRDQKKNMLEQNALWKLQMYLEGDCSHVSSNRKKIEGGVEEPT